VKFWFLLGFDALIAFVALYFFFAGLSDGSVSSFNIGLWLVILLGLAGVLGSSVLLRSAGRRGAAIAVLLVLGIPGFLFVIFFVVLLVSAPRWN
jgi:hypothetical protein